MTDLLKKAFKFKRTADSARVRPNALAKLIFGVVESEAEQSGRAAQSEMKDSG
jgi:hypothetical protein